MKDIVEPLWKEVFAVGKGDFLGGKLVHNEIRSTPHTDIYFQKPVFNAPKESNY